MRSISAVGMNALEQQRGGEPIIVVQVFWGNGSQYRLYADRAFPSLDIEGKILELGAVDDVVNVSGSSNSQSISIKLSDTDGIIKNIFDAVDIHKNPVVVYQWFSEIPFNDKFVIFKGQINTPINWSETERSMAFDIVSQLEDVEIGYSPEEGQFSGIPDDMIGKAWPLPFGTVIRVPAIKLDPIPTGVTTDDTGAYDESLDQQIASLTQQRAYLNNLALAFIIQGGATRNAALSEQGGTLFNPNKEIQQLGDSYIEQGNQLLQQAFQLGQQITDLAAQKQAQRNHERSKIPVSNAQCFPQGQEMSFNTPQGVTYNGFMDQEGFNVSGRTRPENQGTPDDTTSIDTSTATLAQGGPDAPAIVPWGFLWVPPGTSVKMVNNLPIRFIASCIPATVHAVWAWRNFNSARHLTQVPPNYYTVGLVSYGGYVTATQITLTKPLSYYDEGWEDDLYVDMTSSVGSNTTDILAFLVTTYSGGLSCDLSTFTTVHAQVANFPNNFCLMNRMNLMQALQEIAYQSRCQIWLKNGVFYVRYMPAQPVAVDTITEDDVMFNSLELSSTSTEDVVTKLTASYRLSYDQDRQNKIILRKNVAKYGTQAQETDWYAYTHPTLVDLAATFWLIRKSHVWKKLKFNTPLHKLRLESFDYINLDFAHNYASNGSVIGMIESMTVDSDKLECTFVVWLPVRLGDMSTYNWAWPVDNQVNIFPSQNDYPGSGSPNEDTTGDLSPQNGATTCGQSVQINFPPTRRSPQSGAPNPGVENPGDTNAFLYNTNAFQHPTPRPSFLYNYRQARQPSLLVPTIQSGSFPARIVSLISGPAYRCDIYTKGLDNAAIQGTAYPIDPGQTFNVGSMVMVHRLVYDRPDPADSTRTIKSFKNYIAQSASSVYPAQVKAKVGGSTYNVQVYKKGLGDTPEEAKALQLFQNPTDTCPPDSWTLVADGPGSGDNKIYYMQVPVWLS